MADTVTPLNKKTYLSFIERSVGSLQFQSNFALINGVEKDITEAGTLSCGFFVSATLKIFDLIDALHTTVHGTEQDLLRNGWTQTDTYIPGSVVVWEKAQNPDGSMHAHIGFRISETEAISNSTAKKHPVRHNLTFADTRNITAVYTHPFLES